MNQIAIASGDKSPDFIEKIIPVLQGSGTIIANRDLILHQADRSNISSNHLAEMIGENLSGKKVFF